MLQVSSLKKSFGDQVLFEDIEFSVGRGERIGLVGRNGAGKSTILKILMGLESSDGGDVAKAKTYKLGYLEQHIHFTFPTLLEEASSVLPEDEKWDYYKAEKLLFGLGFSEEDLSRSPHEFSGGYQLRINLVKCLLKNPDLLLLDEPTNYLDLPSIRWMQRFLKSYPGELILITHDRQFMDSVVTHVMGLHRTRMIKVAGATEKYYQELAIAEEFYEKDRLKKEKKVQELQRFADRFRAKASKATQAQSKLKQIEKLNVGEKLGKESDIDLDFQYASTHAKTLMTVNDLSFSFDDQADLFRELSFFVKAGDCVAVIGQNGKGKSTLLNVLAAELEKRTGELKFHPDSEIGYYQQTHKKKLNPKKSVYEEVASANPNLTLTQVRGICGALMFEGDLAEKKISVLSGGEQGRVLFAKVIAKPANLLFLDEPSNHLDMQSIEILIDAVRNFSGGVLMVTHDENMLNHLANKLIVFQDGKVQFFERSYQEFLSEIGWSEEKKDKSSIKESTVNNKAAQGEKSGKKARSLSKDRARKLRAIERGIEKLEKEMEQLDLKKLETEAQLVQEAQNPEKVAELAKFLNELNESYEKKFELYEASQARLESFNEEA